MAGSKPGPMAKPDDVRQRANTPASGEQTTINADELPSFIDTTPEPPEASPNWHQIIKDWWESLRADPVRLTMTAGDWMTAKIIAESMSRDLKPQVVGVVPPYKDNETGEFIPGDLKYDVVPINGARMAAFLKFCAMLGLTEGSRRAVGLHIKLGINTDNLDKPKHEKVGKGNRANLFSVPTGDED